MSVQTRLRTFGIALNDNICFPVGTIFAVQRQYEKLGFPDIFSKYKKGGRDLNSLIMALVSASITSRLLACVVSSTIGLLRILVLAERVSGLIAGKSLISLVSMNFRKELFFRVL